MNIKYLPYACQTAVFIIYSLFEDHSRREFFLNSVIMYYGQYSRAVFNQERVYDGAHTVYVLTCDYGCKKDWN